MPDIFLRSATIAAMALTPALAGAQAPAGSAVIQTPQSETDGKSDPTDVNRRHDPGALPRPLNIQLRGEGLRLPPGAESSVTITAPSESTESGSGTPSGAAKPPPERR